jgi:phospholipid/cholesterol/gamma-HCH transport system substrate-binding protein
MAILSDRFEIAFTDETAQNIREAIRNIQEVSAELTNLVGGQQRAVESVADNLRDATETLGEAAATIQRAFEQLEQAVGNDRLVTIVDNVSRTTARTDTLTQDLVEMGQEIRRAAANMDSTLRVVADVAGRLQRGQGTLGMLMADTMLYVRLRESSFELERLLRDIRENPSRYITIRIF